MNKTFDARDDSLSVGNHRCAYNILCFIVHTGLLECISSVFIRRVSAMGI